MPLTGAVSRKISGHRSFNGNLSSQGLASRVVLFKRSVSGSLSWVGDAASQVIQAGSALLDGVLAFTGVLTRKLTLHRSFSGSLDSTGLTEREVFFKRSISGTLSFVGSALDLLFEFFSMALGGGLYASGDVAARFILAGTKMMYKRLHIINLKPFASIKTRRTF